MGLLISVVPLCTGCYEPDRTSRPGGPPKLTPGYVIYGLSGRLREQLLLSRSKMFGVEDNEGVASVEQTRDGGYVFVGDTRKDAAGWYGVWLVRTDAGGETLWTRTFSRTDWAGGNSVHQAGDGGFVITGYTDSHDSPQYDVWLIKTGDRGDTVWTRTYGGIGNDIGYSVCQANDGGYVVVGRTESFGAGGGDVWLVRTDSAGDTTWTRLFGGTSDDGGASVQQTMDGGYILVGYTCSSGAGGQDVYLIKTDANGDTQWTRTYGGAGADAGHAVRQIADGGYIIVGNTESFGAGGQDVWLVKTDAGGDTTWTKTFGGVADDFGVAVQQADDHGYVIAANTLSFGLGFHDVWLIKIDSNGRRMWERTYGGFRHDCAASLQKTQDRGYVILAQSNSFGPGDFDAWLFKTDSRGRISRLRSRKESAQR
jgi:hypothetical protein